MTPRFIAVWLASLLVAVSGCNALLGLDKPKDGYGGISYRCEVVLDEQRDPVDQYTTPAINRCLPRDIPLGPPVMGDGLGNLTSFSITAVPDCTT
jgi:hypothetical protein